MEGDAWSGIALARAYFEELVEPLLAAELPGLRYAAGRLGAGSDVLGLDDATSRDHDWGLRLDLIVPAPVVTDVVGILERQVPETFAGRPTRFAFTGETAARLRIEATTMAGFVEARLGFDPRSGITVHDWLSLTGQSVLEVTAGPVFVDVGGDLQQVRRALEWYPDDLWRYVLACGWTRITQELPLMGRAADVGDDAGSRVIAARLAHVVMHLAFLLERRWAPYAKWFGTAFRTLPSANELAPCIDGILDARTRDDRQHGFAVALQVLLAQQNALGLSDVARATVPFWDRPHLQPDPAIASQLLAAVTDPAVRALPPGRGAAEQRTDNVDVLVDPTARRDATRD